MNGSHYCHFNTARKIAGPPSGQQTAKKAHVVLYLPTYSILCKKLNFVFLGKSSIVIKCSCDKNVVSYILVHLPATSWPRGATSSTRKASRSMLLKWGNMLNDCGAGGIRKNIVNHERLCRYHSPGYARLRVTALDHHPNIRARGRCICTFCSN